VTAVAFDRAGQEMDRKKLDINVGRERFMVRLQPVSAADREGNRVRMVAEVNVPPEHRLDRVELFWNDLKVSTLYQEPFETWVTVENSSAIGYTSGRWPSWMTKARRRMSSSSMRRSF